MSNEIVSKLGIQVYVDAEQVDGRMQATAGQIEKANDRSAASMDRQARVAERYAKTMQNAFGFGGQIAKLENKVARGSFSTKDIQFIERLSAHFSKLASEDIPGAAQEFNRLQQLFQRGMTLRLPEIDGNQQKHARRLLAGVNTDDATLEKVFGKGVATATDPAKTGVTGAEKITRVKSLMKDLAQQAEQTGEITYRQFARMEKFLTSMARNGSVEAKQLLQQLRALKAEGHVQKIGSGVTKVPEPLPISKVTASSAEKITRLTHLMSGLAKQAQDTGEISYKQFQRMEKTLSSMARGGSVEAKKLLEQLRAIKAEGHVQKITSGVTPPPPETVVPKKIVSEGEKIERYKTLLKGLSDQAQNTGQITYKQFERMEEGLTKMVRNGSIGAKQLREELRALKKDGYVETPTHGIVQPAGPSPGETRARLQKEFHSYDKTASQGMQISHHEFLRTKEQLQELARTGDRSAKLMLGSMEKLVRDGFVRGLGPEIDKSRRSLVTFRNEFERGLRGRSVESLQILLKHFEGLGDQTLENKARVAALRDEIKRLQVDAEAVHMDRIVAKHNGEDVATVTGRRDGNARETRTGRGSNMRAGSYLAQNAAYGLEDFAIGYQMGGMKGAIRASSNNLTAMAAAAPGLGAAAAGATVVGAAGASILLPMFMDVQESLDNPMEGMSGQNKTMLAGMYKGEKRQHSFSQSLGASDAEGQKRKIDELKAQRAIEARLEGKAKRLRGQNVDASMEELDWRESKFGATMSMAFMGAGDLYDMSVGRLHDSDVSGWLGDDSDTRRGLRHNLKERARKMGARQQVEQAEEAMREHGSNRQDLTRQIEQAEAAFKANEDLEKAFDRNMDPVHRGGAQTGFAEMNRTLDREMYEAGGLTKRFASEQDINVWHADRQTQVAKDFADLPEEVDADPEYKLKKEEARKAAMQAITDQEVAMVDAYRRAMFQASEAAKELGKNLDLALSDRPQILQQFDRMRENINEMSVDASTKQALLAKVDQNQQKAVKDSSLKMEERIAAMMDRSGETRIRQQFEQMRKDAEATGLNDTGKQADKEQYEGMLADIDKLEKRALRDLQGEHRGPLQATRGSRVGGIEDFDARYSMMGVVGRENQERYGWEGGTLEDQSGDTEVIEVLEDILSEMKRDYEPA